MRTKKKTVEQENFR